MKDINIINDSVVSVNSEADPNVTGITGINDNMLELVTDLKSTILVLTQKVKTLETRLNVLETEATLYERKPDQRQNEVNIQHPRQKLIRAEAHKDANGVVQKPQLPIPGPDEIISLDSPTKSKAGEAFRHTTNDRKNIIRGSNFKNEIIHKSKVIGDSHTKFKVEAASAPDSRKSRKLIYVGNLSRSASHNV